MGCETADRRPGPQRQVGHLNRHVDVIGHLAATVKISEKDGLTIIAPEDDVIEAAWHV
ncbi:MAG: hypothetical protein V3U60_01165 [Gammaproteobacteria bacterium]